MHIAFVSPFDAQDGRAWSSIPTHMAQAFAAYATRLDVVAPLPYGSALRHGVRAARLRLRGRTYSRAHTAEAAEAMAEQAGRALRRLRPDLVVGPSSLPFAALEAGCPVAFWTDLTFEAALYFYAEFGRLEDDNLREGHAIERAALGRATAAVYASEFAARSARDYYGATNTHVVPFGANLEHPPKAADALAAASTRPTDRCELLFVGVEWVRKGGDVAVLVADALNAAGLPTRLHVVGCAPVLERPRSYVIAHGFLDKRTAGGREAFDRLAQSAHFLLMPVRAEAFGCVFCEAGAYAVPSIATTSGGAGGAIVDGENGFLFAPRPSPAEIAARIQDALGTAGAYAELARASRSAFEARLNWHAGAAAVLRALGMPVAADSLPG